MIEKLLLGTELAKEFNPFSYLDDEIVSEIISKLYSKLYHRIMLRIMPRIIRRVFVWPDSWVCQLTENLFESLVVLRGPLEALLSRELSIWRFVSVIDTPRHQETTSDSLPP